MNSNESFKAFIDVKFVGIDRINESSSINVSTSAKFVRVLREYVSAQDVFNKVVSKSASSLSQLCSKKQDCFQPIIEALSTTFCVYSNVQKEFTETFNNIIKNLTAKFENNEENPLQIFTARQMNVIADFKNSSIHLEKSRLKYTSISNSNNDNFHTANSKKIKDTFEISIEKYNNLKLKFVNVVHEGFERSKKIQQEQLEIMRKCLKSVGNALAKLLFDMKECVESLKHFYQTKDKELLFQLWLDSNKTLDSATVDVFPKAVLESGEGAQNDNALIDFNTSPPSSHTPVTSIVETKKKRFQTRRNTTNAVTNEPCIIDQDNPDTPTHLDINADKKTDEKFNVAGMKGNKKKWTGLNILKKFQSTSDLSNVSENKETMNEEGWQSRSNLNEKILIDDEGFIIRDPNLDSNDKLSDSSSSNSSNDRIKGIKVNIRPMDNLVLKSASKTEVINAAMQLPNPKGENIKMNEKRKMSNLQRSSRPVSDIDKDRFSRRSLSVSELRNTEEYLKSPISSEDKPIRENVIIPIACAMTEILSSNDGGITCNIQGQLVLALPAYIKDHLQSSKDILPDCIPLELLSDSYSFSSAKILKQYEGLAKLEIVDPTKCDVKIYKDLLSKVTSDQALANKGIRISFPLLEYLVDINKNTKQIIECQEQWLKVEDSYILFNFTLDSKYILENKSISIKVKLLSSGLIEDVSSVGEFKTEIFNDQIQSIKLGKLDNLVSVKIKTKKCTTIKLQLSYDFVFDSCSLAMPHLLIKPSRVVKVPFKISLTHYRTISTGNFSQTFEFNIS